KRSLLRSGTPVRTAGRVEEAITLLKSEAFSAVLLDYNLPDGNAWPVLEAAQSAVPRIPVIITTAMGNERIAAEALHRGAADYLIKADSFWEQLPVEVQRIVKLAEAEAATARLATIIESSDDGIIGQTLEGVIVSWNSGATAIYGYAASEVIGHSLSLLF